MDMEDFLETVRRYTHVRKITRRLVSELLGIPKRSIENWESGVSKPPEYLVRLIRFYLDHQKN